MAIIPLPEKIDLLPGTFQLSPDTAISSDDQNRWNATYLHDLLSVPTGFPLPILAEAASRTGLIRLQLDPSLASLGPEGYRLQVQPDGILISALETVGVFYGIQSLRQLLPAGVESRQPKVGVDWSIPCQTISDRPRFSWRGFMLDEGRHFHGMETVLQTLDVMALLKLNVFHWHLTEDQGWRIQIKKYPRLTEIGSKRAGTAPNFLARQHDGIPHAGFYTQEQIRQVVAYATERHITVVPEIELPGHCTAALASYPEFSCTGGPFEVVTRFGILPDIYCAGKETTFTFLQDVLDEILELFPSKYIHIGGDEAPKARWKACSDCQRRIKKEGLKDEEALQVWFTNRIMAYLESKGRHGIGWNEILQTGLVKGAVVQFWVGGLKQLRAAIRDEGRQVIMSSTLDTYLDHGYKLMPLSRAYRYEPVPSGLNEKAASSILGLEFPLWTEWVPTKARFDYQAYPRLCALSEVGWTSRHKRSYHDFVRRLQHFLPRLDELGIRYASLEEAEPSRIRRMFGFFTLAIPQKKTA